MTTTPDSRIRADWNPDGTPYDTADRHLGPMTHIDTSTTATTDTSTTAGKIAVMQANERGERVEARVRKSAMPNWYQVDAGELVWDWKCSDYRIAPPVPARTALQRAREIDASDLWTQPLRDLVAEIDSAQRIFVHHNHPIYTESGQAVAPGRYRLVRDDA